MRRTIPFTCNCDVIRARLTGYLAGITTSSLPPSPSHTPTSFNESYNLLQEVPISTLKDWEATHNLETNEKILYGSKQITVVESENRRRLLFNTRLHLTQAEVSVCPIDNSIINDGSAFGAMGALLFSPLLTPRPRTNQNLLLLGGGANTISTFLLNKFPDLRVDSVEIDAEVCKVAEKFFGASDNRLNVVTDCAFNHLATMVKQQQYDMVVVDLDFGNGVNDSIVVPPRRVLDSGFLNELKCVVSPGGVVCVPPLLTPRPRTNQNLLLLGGGANTISTFLLNKFPDLRVDSVEIDAEVCKVAEKFFGASDNRLNVVTDCAFNHLATMVKQQQYDMVVVDLDFGNGVNDSIVVPPRRVLDSGFLNELKCVVSPGGVVCVNTISSPEGYEECVDAFSPHFQQIVVAKAPNSGNRHHTFFLLNDYTNEIDIPTIRHEINQHGLVDDWREWEFVRL